MNTRLDLLRWLAAILLSSALAACTTAAPSPSPPSASGFSAIGKLVLLKGNQVSATASTNSDYVGPPAFTIDGRYLFAVAAGTVFIISVDTGAIANLPCQCHRVMPAGASTVIWLAETNNLMKADLSTPSTLPSPLPVLLRQPIDWDEYQPKLLTVAGNKVLTTYSAQISSYGGPVEIYLTDIAGTTSKLIGSSGNLPVSFAAASAQQADGGHLIALTSGMRSAPCEHASIGIIDSGLGTFRKDVPKLPLGAATQTSYVTDLWWEKNTLHISLSGEACEARSAISDEIGVWRLDTAWSKVATDQPVSTLRHLPGDARLELGPPQQDGTAALSIVEAGTRKQLDPHVYAIAVP
jgi:hypothetical protein